MTYGKIILKWILKIGYEGVIWIQLTQDGVQFLTYEHSKELLGSIKGEDFFIGWAAIISRIAP
jgi:hypothetical protein